MRSSLIGKRSFLLLLAGLLLPATQALAESAVVSEGSRAAGMDNCVAPTEVMRRNHMDFLKHGRDVTVREGDREQDFSLAECIDCHAGTDASGNPIPVDAEGQFCQVCHDYLAVNPDCFQCHRTTPATGNAGYRNPSRISQAIESAGRQRD